jgi:O-antigen ligase
MLKGLKAETCRLRVPSILFAMALVMFPTLLLIFGGLGLPGNSVMTGSLLIFPVIGLCSLGFLNRPVFHFSVLDVLFVLLLIPIAVGGFEYRTLIEIKEVALFVICGFLAYVAGRSTGLEKLAAAPRYTLVLSVIVVALACAATIPELYRVWGVEEKRPLVFGFEHAVNLFAMTLGPLIFGYVYSRTDWKSIQSWAVVILIYFATALFVASLVRYTFAVILVSIGFMLLVSISMKDMAKTYCLVLAMAAVVLGISSGVIARYASVYSFAMEALQRSNDSSLTTRERLERPELILAPGAKLLRQSDVADGENVVARRLLPPSCKFEVGTSNSVSIRLVLYKDIISFAPRSGLFGIGLDNFKKITCVGYHQVHNIYLQTLIEAGWLGGAALVALTVCPFFFLPGLIRSLEPAGLSTLMFLIVSFDFAALLGLAHGTISRELSFFLCAGAISAVVSHLRQSDASDASCRR